MTPRERAEQVQWVGKTPAELWLEIEEIIIAAVEEEREACAKIAEHEAVTVPRGIEAYFAEGYQSAAAYIAELVRARSTASDRSAAPAVK